MSIVSILTAWQVKKPARLSGSPVNLSGMPVDLSGFKKNKRTANPAQGGLFEGGEA